MLTDTIEVSIEDDDTLSASSKLLSFTQSSYFVFEGEGRTELGIVVSDGAGYFSVAAASLGFTATEGLDYAAVAGRVGYEWTIDVLPLTVWTIDDTNLEPDEFVLVSLSDPSNGYEMGIPSEAILTILDDDSPRSILPIRFPIELGNTWTYEVFGEAWQAGGPGPNSMCISTTREDVMDACASPGTTPYTRLRGTSPRVLSELFLSQEGPTLFFFTPADTLGDDPPRSGRGRDPRWRLADLSAGALEPDTLILEGDLTRPYGYTLCLVHQHARTSVAVPGGVFRDVVHVSYVFRQPFSRRVLQLFIADGVGIVKEVGHMSAESDAPGLSRANWTARLVLSDQR